MGRCGDVREDLGHERLAGREAATNNTDASFYRNDYIEGCAVP